MSFPNSYIAWWSRQHRWIRGDWQIIDWLKSCVPLGDGQDGTKSAFCFQPLEDLRQSAPKLVPPAIVALLLAGWFLTPAPMLWSAVVAGLMLWPVLNAFLALLFHPPPPGTRFWRDPRDRGLRVVLTVIFLADNAALVIDAIVRVDLPANDIASAAAGMGDRGGRSPAREKSGTAIHSQQALDPRCLRAPFRRRGVQGTPAMVAASCFFFFFFFFW